MKKLTEKCKEEMKRLRIFSKERSKEDEEKLLKKLRYAAAIAEFLSVALDGCVLGLLLAFLLEHFS